MTNESLLLILVLKKINRLGQHKSVTLGRRRKLTAKITVFLLKF